MKGFKIGHINIRSLVKNIDQLRIYLSNKKYNILSVNETMLDSSIPNDEININGYDIVRKHRNRNGGGVALYIRNVIDYKIRNDLMNEKLETITIEVCPSKAKPKPKTNFMKKSISYSGALLWNNLLTAAKQQGITISEFKNILGSQYSFCG